MMQTIETHFSAHLNASKAWLQKGAKDVKFDACVKQHLEKRSSIFARLQLWDVSRFE